MGHLGSRVGLAIVGAARGCRILETRLLVGNNREKPTDRRGKASWLRAFLLGSNGGGWQRDGSSGTLVADDFPNEKLSFSFNSELLRSGCLH